MSEWVKFHRGLTRGAKRGLRRAHRFVFLELSLEARPGHGTIELPRGMSDDAAVLDLLGGDAGEVRGALKALTAEPDPMVRFYDCEGLRVLEVLSWSRWNAAPGGSTERVQALRARRKGDQAGDRVYFIRRPSTSEIKIGFTANIVDRLSNLSLELEERLVLLGSIPGGQPLELEWHGRFAASRTRGEWFQETPELIEAIDRVTVTRDQGNAPGNGRVIEPSGEERRGEKRRAETPCSPPPAATAETGEAETGAAGAAPTAGRTLAEIFEAGLGAATVGLEIPSDDPAVIPRSRTKPAARATRCPTSVDPDAATWCARHEIPPPSDPEVAKMLDHFAASPRGTKLDWLATWRNWKRESERRNGGRGRPVQPTSQPGREHWRPNDAAKEAFDDEHMSPAERARQIPF